MQMIVLSTYALVHACPCTAGVEQSVVYAHAITCLDMHTRMKIEHANAPIDGSYILFLYAYSYAYSLTRQHSEYQMTDVSFHKHISAQSPAQYVIIHTYMYTHAYIFT